MRGLAKGWLHVAFLAAILDTPPDLDAGGATVELAMEPVFCDRSSRSRRGCRSRARFASGMGLVRSDRATVPLAGLHHSGSLSRCVASQCGGVECPVAGLERLAHRVLMAKRYVP